MQVCRKCLQLLQFIPSERRDHVLPEFFVLGHLKGVHWNVRAQRNEVLQILYDEKGITATDDDLSDVVSVAAFVLLNNVEINGRPSKRVTLLLSKALKMAFKH